VRGHIAHVYASKGTAAMNAIMPIRLALSSNSWRVDMVILLCRGVSIAEACRELGISRARYYRHVKADLVFAEQVLRAKSSVSSELTRVIVKSQNWRAAAWWLEKRNPREWGSMRNRMKLEKCTCGAADYIDPRWR
jgi:hypothetical protein